MPWLSEDLKRRIREEEWVQSYRDLSASLESEGRIPAGPTFLLRRSDRAFAITGGVLCGGLIAALTVLLDFILFNYLLHFF